ncbi:exopolyphosphatase [Sansalvadorimonas sp. 2012CJ34-2]|uniref:Exopolyphosphatase n=1 Tax=Parendozoicomonas callyspongiae TaxID=2942213 RepID=A0ABT0PHK3_9GAMM|nr:exopolyphosphatase [Sansalvadorimonas sp. 2012CJ34-2]MCL6270855.1 exopolyphosphatase [Sansalvadorimonas sp. 2012CJ34-2]
MSELDTEQYDNTPLVAAIDLGSNSFHLIVARMDHGELRPVERLGEKVQLAAGLDEDNNLTEEAMQRGLSCLRKLGQYCAGMNDTSIRVVGTNALRKAKNAHEFARRAHAVLGHPVDIIAGREEARLIYLGVAHTQSDDHDKRLVVDIGGGSTEFIIGERFEPKLLESLHMGCVSWTKQYFPDGKITARQFDEAYYSARLELLNIEHEYRDLGWEEAIGSSGSIKSICNVLIERGHDAITPKGLEQLRKELLRYKHVDRIAFTGLKPERVSIFPGGLAILCAIFDSLKIKRMSFSEGALREGLLYDMVGRSGHEDVRKRTVKAIQKRYHADKKQARRVKQTLKTFLENAQSNWDLTDEDCELLLSAAMVHEIGLDISHTQFHRHGAYILRNADLLGFNKRQQQNLSMLVRGHRRSLPLQSLFQMPKEECHRLLKLMALLRLAILLNHQRSDYLPEYDFSVSGRRITLEFPKGWLEKNPLTQADFEQEQQYLTRAGYRFEVT